MTMSNQLFNQLPLTILIILSSFNPIQSSDELSQSKGPTMKKVPVFEPHEWSYIDQKDWLNLNGSRCGGDRQSPINLDSSKARVDKTLTLDTNYYDKHVEPDEGTVFSTGHSLQMDINNPGTYSLTGSAVDGYIYELLQVHLHWGKNSMSGSEHAIDGERFSAEIHFVHRNKIYKNRTKAAAENSNGLTVLAVIAKNGDSNPGLKVLLGTVESDHPNQKFRLKSNFNLKDFLPKNKKSFFKYAGSLTTPNCQESVNWIVMKDTITVSNEQIDKLRELIDEHGVKMVDVVRDIQPPQGRAIFQSDSGSAMVPTLTSLCYIILYLIVHITLIHKSILD